MALRCNFYRSELFEACYGALALGVMFSAILTNKRWFVMLGRTDESSDRSNARKGQQTRRYCLGIPLVSALSIAQLIGEFGSRSWLILSHMNRCQSETAGDNQLLGLTGLLPTYHPIGG
jgi:hypothetical protein